MLGWVVGRLGTSIVTSEILYACFGSFSIIGTGVPCGTTLVALRVVQDGEYSNC